MRSPRCQVNIRGRLCFSIFECIAIPAGGATEAGVCGAAVSSEPPRGLWRVALLKKHQRINFDDRVKFGLLVCIVGLNAFLTFDNR
jgi:hypothetical protein